MNKQLSITLFLLLGLTLTAQAQRTITAITEHTILQGQSYTIDGVEQSAPDIYYVDNGDGTYTAHRLTVKPVTSKAADVTAPYLNQATTNSIQVNWKTRKAAEGSIVSYGLDADNLDRQATSTSVRLGNGYNWHTAVLTGLEADTEYYYQVTSDGVESPVSHFRTMPEATDGRPFRILVIGDHQRNEHSDYEWLLRMAERKAAEKYGKATLEDNVSFLLNVGDQVDEGTLQQYEFTHLYKSREVMSRLPVQTCVGNHELKQDADLKLYNGHYASYGDISYRGIRSNTANYYAYQAGPVLFVVLNSDGTTPQQKMWVRRVIAAADDDPDVKFIVSLQHRPLYAEQYTYDVSPWMLNEIMPILSASKKHVINCAGHHHLYARGQMTPWPVYHIITGGGVGTSAEGYEQLWGTTPDNLDREEVQKTIDQWTYQLFEFDPATLTMTVETYSIGNSRIGLDNVLVDRFTRCLSATTPPATPSVAAPAAPLTLPADITQDNAPENLHSAEYQVARDDAFSDVVLSRVVTFEDLYQVDGNYLPKDQNAGQPVTTLRLKASDLKTGHYFLRCRNRSMNLDWSDYSEPVAIEVAGTPQSAISLSRYYYQPGTVSITFENAPVGTDAWVGIYQQGKRPGTSDTSYSYLYTQVAAGTLDFTVNDTGEYFAVLFGSGGYDEVTERIGFVVTNSTTDDAPLTVSTDKQVYAVGDPVNITFAHAPALKNDWVGLYLLGDVPVSGKSQSYAYTGQQTDGTVALNVSGNHNYNGPVADGLYFVNYFLADGYTEPAGRQSIVVGRPVMLVPVYERHTDGQPVSFLFEGAPTWLDCQLVLTNEAQNTTQTLDMSHEEGGRVETAPLTAGTWQAVVKALDREISQPLTITVEPSTGVTPVSHPARPSQVYSITGCPLPHLQSGVNIVRQTDGTVRKILVKEQP